MKLLENKFGFKFKNLELYSTALTHRSYLNENRKIVEHNERLEFLGDAVLQMVITKYLFIRFPEGSEWYLTSIRAALVNRDMLFEVARNLELWKYLKLSKWEIKSNGRDSHYILANAVEALIGAIYLDQWIEKVEIFIDIFFIIHLNKILEDERYINVKTKLQVYTQSRLKITPSYKVLREIWPDHSKMFTVWVYLLDVVIWIWVWDNKQNAQVSAAKNACLLLWI